MIAGMAEYPENLEQTMKAAGINVDALDALSLAQEAKISSRLAVSISF